jgi:transposase
VGPRLSEAIVALFDDPKRFKNVKQVGSYLGLVPTQHQSGNMNRLGRITHRGNRVVRSLLVEVGWIGLRYNSWMRETFEHVRRNTKSRKRIAIVAVARRLLIRCWAMLRDNKPWQPDRKSARLQTTNA